MPVVRTLVAFVIASLVAYGLAAVFYTQQILTAQAAIGAEYSAAQTRATYLDNLAGLATAYLPVLATALGLGFLVAFAVKRLLKPLAPIAYPAAGAAAVFTAIWLIENVMAGGGAGAIGGARTTAGLALQCFAGAVGGLVFAVLRPSA